MSWREHRTSQENSLGEVGERVERLVASTGRAAVEPRMAMLARVVRAVENFIVVILLSFAFEKVLKCATNG